MAETIYYRPEWTCGRYHKVAKVALCYNLIEGMSYFFEGDSAEIVGCLLATERNGSISVDALALGTNTALESLIPFLEELTKVGLLITKLVTPEVVRAYRKAAADYKCTQSQTQVKSIKEKLPMAVSNAERSYMDAVEGVASVMLELTYDCSEQCIHCYNIGATRNDAEVSQRHSTSTISLHDYQRIIDELNEQGLVKVCLSGGDPFSNPCLLYTSDAADE